VTTADETKKAQAAVMDAIAAEAKRRKLKFTMGNYGELVMGGAKVVVACRDYSSKRSITVSSTTYGGAMARSFPWHPGKPDEAIAKAPKIVQALIEVDEAVRANRSERETLENALLAAAAAGVKALKAGGVAAYADSSVSGGYRSKEHVSIFLDTKGGRDYSTTTYISATHHEGHLEIAHTIRVSVPLAHAAEVVKTIQRATAEIEKVATPRDEDADGPE
jgi:hypothetical protein